MRVDKRCSVLIHPDDHADGIYQDVPAHDAGWAHLNFGARRMRAGEEWKHSTDEYELCVVLLGGVFSIQSKWGKWGTQNARINVFGGLPHAAYLPPDTEFTLTCRSNTLDIAYGYTEGSAGFKGFLITPEDVQNFGIELRGGDNASRQINSILPPGSSCHRLVCVEVYTPSGNWSSFPAHKHDNRVFDEKGKLVEAKLEEIYLYKFDKPQGFALQKIYTSDRNLDEIAEAHTDDVVLVPRGYHPVSAGHGYNTYYLNMLSGSDQSLANSDDPDHKWIYGTWKKMDERLPLVTLEMNSVG